ncbi:sensor histidine kinase [Flavihumibacter solisilvae]|uniref:sensor histidine kinase n=1 Tax=Flavihumibacter solisilvae TaxID=1349421 RepID=UPI00068D5D77|nr:histidine kinase [Flavihumibacter solisilvae]
MSMHEFIFTERKPAKYYRHLCFWLLHSAFWLIWATVFFFDFKSFIQWSLKSQFQFQVFIAIALTYSVTYFIIPKYFMTKKYRLFAAWMFAALLLAYLLFMTNQILAFDILQLPPDERKMIAWYFSMNYIINGPPVSCAMFLTLKLFKNYHFKMEEKKQLIRENSKAELQLLKAQIHPHFLFNTLNNIYSFALDRSPVAGELVDKLSDTIGYMVNDCREPLVPLDKEIRMVVDYVELEKVRYGDRLDFRIEVNGDVSQKFIAPLLLIPFVENSFKHGASIMRGNQWVRMVLDVAGDMVSFRLANSKPASDIHSNGNSGIGLKNVKKRLQLLYPGRHSLAIESTDTVFNVKLQLALTA